jgi:glycerophosphoryl diester phosphodiesterase
VVLTKDNVPVVFHDLILDEVTNVRECFPTRHRSDGHFYVIDFDFYEIRQLQVHERVDPKTGAGVYPNRFHKRCDFKIESLNTEIEFIQELNRCRGQPRALYTEVKSPAFHHEHGKDLSRIVLSTLEHYGYRSKSDAVWLQCFDFKELTRIHNEMKCQLKLVQLIGENEWNESTTDYTWAQSPEGLNAIAGIADGIGPWIPQIVTWSESGQHHLSVLVSNAHAAGLEVHPYTFRVDDLPANAPSASEVHRVLFNEAQVDGLFSDFCDISLHYRETLA